MGSDDGPRAVLVYAGSAAVIIDDADFGSAVDYGAYGVDVIFGVTDFVGSTAGDTFRLTAGSNSVSGGDGNDLISTGVDRDSLFGGSGDDTLIGGAGGDVLDGGSGSDWVSYAGAASRVAVALTNGPPTAGEAAGDVLTGVEHLEGSGFGDTLTGSSLGNSILGGAGADTLRGAAGADTLVGGTGRDVLSGGGDADRFVFLAAVDSPNAARDTVQDFSTTTGDVLDLSALAGPALNFVGPAAFTGTGQVRFVQQNGQTIVSVNLSGSATPELSVTLQGTLALTADDFLL